MKSKVSLSTLLPVLFSFYIVGFCDIISISVNYVQNDFQLSDTIAGLFPAVVFIWFLFFSAPVATLANKIGCKRMVLYGMLLIVLGMFVPFFMYNLLGCFVTFVMLGIGNVILQVTLNPLLACVVSSHALSATLTSTQLIKGISAFCGPFLSAFTMSFWGYWHYVFPIFGVIALISAFWLLFTSVKVTSICTYATFSESFALLKDYHILLLFLSIVCAVGIDVGMNVCIPKLMMIRCGHTIQDAALSSSVYFAFRTLGVFVGTILLVNLSELKYLRIHVLLMLIAAFLLLFAEGEYFILTLAGMVGFGCSSIFTVICSIALKSYSDKVNKVSVLMMMGICGGAFVPFLMGVVLDYVGSMVVALMVVIACMFCLLYCSFGFPTGYFIRKREA